MTKTEFVYPSERHVIKKYRNSYGDVVKIYDTDGEHILDQVYNKYFMHNDITNMLVIAKEKKIPKEKRGNEFLKRTYESIKYQRTWRCRPDPIYD